MNRIGVMQITDTLEAGGAERVAVNLANLLPRERYRTYLCSTRRDGALSDLVSRDVGRLRLGRKGRFDLSAVKRLATFIREQDIQILHAHGSSLFTASIASLLRPHPAVVWHEHSGLYASEDRAARSHRLAARRVSGVIAVNQALVQWSQRRLSVPADRIWYVPNFVCEAKLNGERPRLPGRAGTRMVCVANLRAEKDQLSLIRAMALVIGQVPAAHLLLVGAASGQAYGDLIRREIAQRNLAQNVSMLGLRSDVPAILRACDVAVISSASEGLPLALIEYGMAGLPTVATRVGQCAEVLDEGRVGLLVPPRSPDHLAEALLSLLKSPERRAAFGEKFRHRVRQVYSADTIVNRISQIYETVLRAKDGRG